MKALAGSFALVGLLAVGTGTASAQTHTVRAGETLSALAQKYHTTVANLAAVNHIADPNRIYTNQTLTVSWDTIIRAAGQHQVRIQRSPAIYVQPTANQWSSPTPTVPTGGLGGVWACIRFHESGGNYAINTGNGYYGAYQFTPGTWNYAVRGAGYPQYANGRADLAPPGVQDAAAVWLQAHAGWSPWPNTSRMCGA